MKLEKPDAWLNAEIATTCGCRLAERTHMLATKVSRLIWQFSAMRGSRQTAKP